MALINSSKNIMIKYISISLALLLLAISSFAQSEFFGYDGGISVSYAHGVQNTMPNHRINAIGIEACFPSGFNVGFSSESLEKHTAQTLQAGYMLKSDNDRGYPNLGFNLLYAFIDNSEAWGININSYLFFFPETNFPSNLSPGFTVINVNDNSTSINTSFVTTFSFTFKQAFFYDKQVNPFIGLNYTFGHSKVYLVSAGCNIKFVKNNDFEEDL